MLVPCSVLLSDQVLRIAIAPTSNKTDALGFRVGEEHQVAIISNELIAFRKGTREKERKRVGDIVPFRMSSCSQRLSVSVIPLLLMGTRQKKQVHNTVREIYTYTVYIERDKQEGRTTTARKTRNAPTPSV